MEEFMRRAVKNVLGNATGTEELDWDLSEHLRKTPERWYTMMQELTQPQRFDFTVFPNDEGYDQMVAVGPTPFFSFCAHHVIPFYGEAHVAYIPHVNVVGLSKLVRAVKEMSKGLWTQEGLTQTIMNFLVDELDPVGVAVVMRAEHLCMSMRGVQTPGTRTTTSAMHGAFLDPAKQARQEFLALAMGVQS